jgi:hypothetical protein
LGIYSKQWQTHEFFEAWAHRKAVLKKFSDNYNHHKDLAEDRVEEAYT